MLALLALPPVAAVTAYLFYNPFRSWVDNQFAHLHHVKPGTAPGTTPSTTAPDVKSAPVAVGPRYETDYGLTVTILRNPNGTYRHEWRTPDGRNAPDGYEGPIAYPSSDAAAQGAMDLMGMQFATKPWDVQNPGGAQPVPNARLDKSGNVISPQPGPTVAVPGAVPGIPDAINPSVAAIPANWPRDTYGNPVGAAPPAPGAQVVGIPTITGGVNVYVEPDRDSPGNFKATFKLPPKTGPNDPWTVATGKTLQDAANSAATTIGLLGPKA